MNASLWQNRSCATHMRFFSHKRLGLEDIVHSSSSGEIHSHFIDITGAIVLETIDAGVARVQNTKVNMNWLGVENRKCEVHIDYLVGGVERASLNAGIVEITYGFVVVEIEDPLTISGNVIEAILKAYSMEGSCGWRC